mgnify:CR=1 FL=1
MRFEFLQQFCEHLLPQGRELLQDVLCKVGQFAAPFSLTADLGLDEFSAEGFFGRFEPAPDEPVALIEAFGCLFDRTRLLDRLQDPGRPESKTVATIHLEPHLDARSQGRSWTVRLFGVG